MTERERWIVYPLLVVAVSLGIKDRIRPPAEFRAQRIICNDLTVAKQIACSELAATKQVAVIDEELSIRARMLATPSGGAMAIYGGDGNLRVSLATDPNDRAGEITTYEHEDRAMARIDTTDEGTRLLLFNHDDVEPRQPMASIDAFELGSRLVLRDQSLDPRAALFAVDHGGWGVTYDAQGGVHPMVTVTVNQRLPSPADPQGNPPDDPVPTLDKIPPPSSEDRPAAEKTEGEQESDSAPQTPTTESPNEPETTDESADE